VTANQPPPLEHWNLATADPLLIDQLDAQGAGWSLEETTSLGARLGEPEVIEWGFQANRFEPELRTHDRFGDRIDEVEFHPAWHALMDLAVSHGLHGAPWADGRQGAHVARAAMFYLVSQNEAGHGCPISMTYSVLPALREQPDVASAWEGGLTSRTYDPRSMPSDAKRGLLAGMAMTERQGGTDVRANTSTARPVADGGPGGEYEITGHKWFCSAPMCDVFLVLAQARGGLSCFLVPRRRPDGARNGFHIERLKDKLGNRSNASSEVRFESATGWLIGQEGRGIQTIINMVNHTRLDCVIGSAAIVRQAVTQAAHHVRHRAVFGKLLVDQPLMRSVVADLGLESEAATAGMMRLAGAFDRAAADQQEAAFRRIATPILKFWTTRRATPTIVEALECHGGNGYVEESPLPRLLRESPLNSIWEGSGNVMCLDVLRAARDPRAVEAFAEELRQVEGTDRRLDTSIAATVEALAAPDRIGEAAARAFTASAALVLQASLLVRFAPAPVADAFIGTRLESPSPVFGAGRLGDESVAVVIERISPAA
jgi:putative acyl-CoA dehydrogenase